jgi:hypothetical protein
LNRAAFIVWAMLAPAILVGCRTSPTPDPRPSLADWTIRSAQALWRPSADAQDIAGEVLLATDDAGGVVIEFSKGGLPITSVQAYSEPARWRLDLLTRRRSIGGSGPPPPRSAWLVLAHDLAHRPPPAGWELLFPAPGRLHLTCAQTGEHLELQLISD